MIGLAICCGVSLSCCRVFFLAALATFEPDYGTCLSVQRREEREAEIAEAEKTDEDSAPKIRDGRYPIM